MYTERKFRHVLRVFWLPFVKIMGGLINSVVTTWSISIIIQAICSFRRIIGWWQLLLITCIQAVFRSPCLIKLVDVCFTLSLTISSMLRNSSSFPNTESLQLWFQLSSAHTPVALKKMFLVNTTKLYVTETIKSLIKRRCEVIDDLYYFAKTHSSLIIQYNLN
jgi:hypothetical protein